MLRYDTVGNRVNEQRAGFSFGFWYNKSNQMTARQWQGGLTVSGRTQPGAANVLVNARAAQVDAGGEYVVEKLDVTTPLLSDQGSVGLVAELQFTNYNLQFGAEGTIKTRRHEGKDEVRMQSRRSKKSEVLHKGAPASAATVAAIADRGNVEAASCRLDDEKSTRSQDGSATRGPADARRTNVERQTSNVILHIYDSIGNVRHKAIVGDGSAGVAATYEYDPFGRLLYADQPPAYKTAQQFLFSTKLYESHWQHYYYGYRYYSPDSGRWLNRDPTGEADGPNVYCSADNNLIMQYDAHGLMGVRPPHCCNGKELDPKTHCCCRTGDNERKYRRGKVDVGINIVYYQDEGKNAFPAHYYLAWKTRGTVRSMGHNALNTNTGRSPDAYEQESEEHKTYVSQKVDRCTHDVAAIKRCLNKRADTLTCTPERGYSWDKCKMWAEEELRKCISEGARTQPSSPRVRP